MSKRKPRRQRLPRRERRQPRQPAPDLQGTLDRADRMISRGRAPEAISILEPLLEYYPRAVDLHYLLGYARGETGDLWGALNGYERALELSRDPGYWLPLGSLYLGLELMAHAVHAFRQVLKHQLDVAMNSDVRGVIASLEEGIAHTAENLNLPVAQVERGLHWLEKGQRALAANDFPDCIATSRQATKLLGSWPPPQNNLSLALFYDGQPEKAIAIARQVLSQYPDNIQALGNAIRFLAWTGEKAGAREFWPQLKGLTPQRESERFKMAEAAAMIEDDEAVYRLLKPFDKPGAAAETQPSLFQKAQFFLAIAEANMGRRAARRRLSSLQSVAPWFGDLLAALEAGQPGPGWADRYPYFYSMELLPRPRLDELITLLSRENELGPRRFRREMSRFAARFPQIVLVAEKMIWEDAQPEAGVSILGAVATPAAHAAVRRFGLSQAGDDDDRMQALLSLLHAGEITPDEILRVWIRGEWREVQLRGYEISEEFEPEYEAETVDLLNQGLEAFQQDDLDEAERLFQQVLEREPRAAAAYDNLGSLYANRGEHERAKEMFQAALEIDPLDVFARCNLALYLLDEDDVGGAEDMIAPLADVQRLHPQDMAFLTCTRAHILLKRGDIDEARRALELALEIYPEYDLAQDLLDRLDTFGTLRWGLGSFFEKLYKNRRTRRLRQQGVLNTPDPTLSEALAVYTKGGLTGMARVILPWGGWSALRKAELFQRVLEALADPRVVERIVADLSDEERAALRRVLARGGQMPWQEFDADYGNDLEESPNWEYHEPETLMGRLRLRGLLAETTVKDELLVTIPSDLRAPLAQILD